MEGTGVDINEELAAIADAANSGEEGPEGEGRLAQEYIYILFFLQLLLLV